MSYKSRRGQHFIRSSSPDDSIEAGSTASIEEPAPKIRRASVYDAVAGRVTTTLPIGASYSKQSRVRHHKRHSPDRFRDPTLAPEEVLFKPVGAPVRYAEKDIYQAHEHLPDGGRDVLPDSDLLKTIHSYASHFYSHLPANKRFVRGGASEGISERSMDETALLAFGMLLEEAGREALGKDGDLVFTEGVEVAENGGSHDENENEEAEVFGFTDAPRYEAREYLKRPRDPVAE
ncbi:hypothetical protein F4861DRAFT_321769 [Xylaria intraflava]|nr:hypothetical protein F4861DRAFT_321769 [Xylaria intraflava]